MCKITFKAKVVDNGNSPFSVSDELLISVKYKREHQLCYDFSEEQSQEPMCECEARIVRAVA